MSDSRLTVVGPLGSEERFQYSLMGAAGVLIGDVDSGSPSRIGLAITCT